MKAITLWQPWASMIAFGAKRCETRSWSTKHRGTIAIHAALSGPKFLSVTAKTETSRVLVERAHKGLESKAAYGAVVATAELVECVLMTPELIAAQGPRELNLGDWRPGRYAWVLENVTELEKPVIAKGHQGLWEWHATLDQALTARDAMLVTSLQRAARGDA